MCAATSKLSPQRGENQGENRRKTGGKTARSPSKIRGKTGEGKTPHTPWVPSARLGLARHSRTARIRTGNPHPSNISEIVLCPAAP